MGFAIKSEKAIGGVPVFQNGVLEVAQGGFTLDTTGLVAGALVPEGTAMAFDEATRKAKPLRVATMQAAAAADATEYKVKKNHLLVVGAVIGAVIGGAAYAITAIDTANADYDLVTVGTTLGALAAGDAVFESAETGADKCALKVSPKGLLFQEVKAEANTPCSVVIRGTVYERRIPIVTAAVKALLPNIIFSQSY